MSSCSFEYIALTTTSLPLAALIATQSKAYPSECISTQLTARAEASKSQQSSEKETAFTIRRLAPESVQQAMDLAQEKGASSWLTCLPIQEFGFSLSRSLDSPSTRVPSGMLWPSDMDGLLSTLLPTVPVVFPSLQQALSCPKGCFPIFRHNEMWDLTANLLTEVCHDVCIEPPLQPLTNEALLGATVINTDGAKLDVAASGFWGSRHE